MPVKAAPAPAAMAATSTSPTRAHPPTTAASPTPKIYLDPSKSTRPDNLSKEILGTRLEIGKTREPTV